MLELVTRMMNSQRFRNVSSRLQANEGRTGRNRFGFYDPTFKALAWLITSEYPEGFVNGGGQTALLKVLLVVWWKTASANPEERERLLDKLNTKLETMLTDAQVR